MWIEALKNHGRSVLLMLLISFTSMFQLGYVIGYPNTAFDSFKNFINESLTKRGDEVNENQFNWIWSAMLSMWSVGFLIGTVVTPFIAEKYGRKVGIMFGNFIDVFATGVTVLGIAVHLPELMGLGRLLLGLGDGIASNCLTLFLQESAPTKIRGLVSGFQELSVCFSILLGLVLGSHSLLGHSLLVLTGLAMIPSAVAVLVMFFCPDSPKFICLKKQNEKEAIASLIFYQGVECDVAQAFESYSKEKDSGKVTLRQIWNTSSLRKATILGSVVFILQVFTGIFPIALFSSVFFVNVGFTQEWAENFSILMVVVNCLATALSLNFVDRFGRRTLLLWFGGLNVLSTIVYVVLADLGPSSQSWAKYGCAITMLAFNATFSFGLGPIPWYLSAELVPQHQRSLVQCIAYSCNTVISFITVQLTLPLFGYLGVYSFIPLFIVPSICCLIYLYREMPETKNKEIYEVVLKLQKR